MSWGQLFASCREQWGRGHAIARGASALLTEQEVARTWSQVFKSSHIESSSFERAEQLLEELRPESPLRLRLTMELEELRSMQAKRSRVAAQR
jgi:hypothetical protein